MSDKVADVACGGLLLDDAAVTPQPYLLKRGGAPRPSLREKFNRAVALLHRIIGAPDYDAYLRHHIRTHPESTPLSKAEFVNQHFTNKYSRPGTRCC